MSDYDVSIDDQIAALHDEAEFCRDQARAAGDPAIADRYRTAATRKVKQAARLRAQAGGE